MKKIDTKKVHEDFHAKTKKQLKVIGENNFTYKIILKILNNYLKPTQDVLDIGCGAGTLSYYLAQKTHSVCGIDISELAIDKCNETKKSLDLKNIEFKVMNFPYEIPKKKYDLIICFEVIEHLQEDELALEQIYSLLNPNGLLILSTPSLNAPLHRLGYTKEFDKKVGHLRRYTENELVKMFRSAGFSILSVKKTEGIIRNFLFLNSVAGKAIRFIKFFLVDILLFIDHISLTLFGESDIFIIAQKPGSKR